MAHGKKYHRTGRVVGETVLIFIGVGVFALSSAVSGSRSRSAAAINGTRPIGQPDQCAVDLIHGRLRWSGAATGVLILEIVLLAS